MSATERATLGGLTCRQVGERLIETTPSTATTDRMGDRVFQQWRLDEFRRNPVVFFNHQTEALPIAKSIWIDVVDGALRSRDQFPPRGLHPFADQVYDLVLAGFINAKSVGFRPDRKVWNPERGGWDFLENTLLEHSYVGLPANVEATVAGRAAPDVAAVRKWFGERPVLRLVPEGFGVQREQSCPAGALCVNPAQIEMCPAGSRCPATGNARTSWDGRDERIVRVLDDREPVWRVDPAQFAQAWQLAVSDVVTATYNRLKGRVD
jgi:HK97 family phage prohead protease